MGTQHRDDTRDDARRLLALLDVADYLLGRMYGYGATQERLLADYASEVMGQGHGVSRHWPYSYAKLANGLHANGVLLALYDRFADAHQEGNGAGLSDFALRNAMTSARSLPRGRPAKLIAVPGT